MTDAWRWSPDLPEDPYPKYADARLDPGVRADVPFQDADDPEGAVAWLDQELERNDQAMAGVARLNHRVISRDLMAETLWVRDDAVASGSCSSCRHAAQQGPSGAWWHVISVCSDRGASFTLDPPRYPGAPWPVRDAPPTAHEIELDRREQERMNERIQPLPNGELTIPIDPVREDTDWIPFEQGGWISGSCWFR